ncbi:MAG TPA: MurR/RpiR family transcriptional regulator [Pyrinomonadaceae bacterium]|nr:MurR/RpiR family transcriptional regulator [Pyrinomonadaceae bacterium]
MKRTNSRKNIGVSESPNGPDGAGAASTLETRFAAARNQLNPRRQRLLRAILDSADETCFLSSREMAKRFHIDATTILRTTQVLGYASWADFATDLRQHFISHINPYTVMKAATKEKRSVQDHIEHSFDKALDNLNAVRSDLDRQGIITVAKAIKRSRRVLVVGLDFAASLSYYLSYGLVTLGFDAEAPAGSGNLQYKVEVLTSKDLLIAISFGQCLRDTVDSVLRAKKQGVRTIGITDNNTSPVARFCDSYLITPVVSPSFLVSYVAPVATISAIHVACAHLDPNRSLSRLRPTDREYAAGHRWYREPRRSNGDTT